MIERSPQFDLGQDRTRIKDPRDAERQTATVDTLLQRLFEPRPDHRWEVQILADEVGMGKTFVALGLAYSVLDAMRSGTADADLRGCYQKVLIITPSNAALLAKWRREVGEFVKRCVKLEYQPEATRWFQAKPIDRIDELACELRRSGTGSRVIVVSMSVFDGSRLQHYDLKRRHLLSTLFRYWGARFKGEHRERLLKGAPNGWPTDPRLLNDFSDAEWSQIQFSEDELLIGLRQLDRPDGCVESLLGTCKEIAAPYVRGRDTLFSKVETQLVEVYRELVGQMVNKALPLVIVDEAHHWKNGPISGSNGYKRYVDLIGCRSRRAVLLTATPFQLSPSEMLEILKVGDHLRTGPTEAESAVRQERLVRHRENVVRPVLDAAASSSRRFAKAWSKLPPRVTRDVIETAWGSPALSSARDRLQEVARQRGAINAQELERIIDAAVSDVDPDIRQLLREGMRLFVYNADLSHELGAIVIRHRRHTGHRMFRVGMEYQTPVNGEDAGGLNRLDRHVLHAAPGVDVRGEGELPHYLLMRCVSEMKGGKGRSSLGSALTGCYSTLIESSEGRAVKNRLAETETGKVYLDLLMGMVAAKHDPRHPKVREVVDAVLKNWQWGEKTLIFCFRTNTANRIHEIIEQRIRKELNKRRERCMGGPESLKALRSRLTGRDRDLVVLGLDRVLWSVLWTDHLSEMCDRQIAPDDLEIMDHELPQLVRLGLRYGVDLERDHIDRVFLHRATEHIIAQRLLHNLNPRGKLKCLLQELAHDAWIAGPYGLSPGSDDDDEGTESAHFDERGVHSLYSAEIEADPAEVDRIAIVLQERRSRARIQDQISVLDVYGRGPNLWLGSDPRKEWETRDNHQGLAKTLREMHAHLLALTLPEEPRIRDGNEFDWESRRVGFQAVRRAVLRESVLLRLLPGKKDRDDSGWGELLVHSFFACLPQQRESMADRISVFLEDLMAASGSLTDRNSARFSLYNATRLRDQQFVALVSGDTDARSRERVFSGLSSALLPEVLICTSVGQEGIDLHRHCRHVVHFDLAWNPAVLEQRTGRADRIGSKTFRERALSGGPADSFLEIGVPFLAGTYDERMYEELRIRAQTFEVLTGGDLTADEVKGDDDQQHADGQETGLRFVPLPDSMIVAMRVNLHVWTES